jgi:chromosomal replication initiator protein
MPSFSLDAWIRPLSLHLEDDGDGGESGSGNGSRARILCPTAFHRDRVRERFLGPLASSIREELGHAVEVELVLCPALPEERPSAEESAPPTRPAKQPKSSPAAPVRRAPVPAAVPATMSAAPVQVELPYRFDNFVVGDCNALAREASLAVARTTQHVNPLFLWSEEPGRGKTHLARAIVAEAQAAGSRRVLYASAETFTNDFMSCIRDKRMDRFKRRYREGCDLLVVEDVQFLERKKATQLELFHTMIHLLDVGAWVVMTGNRLPVELSGIDARLQSQMSAGLVAELEAPDATVRREILRRSAASGGVRLPEDCRELLVDRVRGNLRDLEGVLIQLVASASLLKRPIDMELTQNALRKVAPMTREEKQLEVAAVLDVVASFFKTRVEALAARSRRRDVLVPRQLAMYLCRRYTDASVADIARLFGREHPSVRNACKRVERRIMESAPARYQLEALCARLDKLARMD